MLYFAKQVQKKSIKFLSPYFHELMGRIEEHVGKKYLMVDSHMLDKVLDKIKEIKGI